MKQNETADIELSGDEQVEVTDIKGKGEAQRAVGEIKVGGEKYNFQLYGSQDLPESRDLIYNSSGPKEDTERWTADLYPGKENFKILNDDWEPHSYSGEWQKTVRRIAEKVNERMLGDA